MYFEEVVGRSEEREAVARRWAVGGWSRVVGGEEAACWEAGQIGAGNLCHIVAVPPRAYLRSKATTS